MKAKKVYEFVQRKDIKAEIGSSVLIKRSIIEWFENHAPEADYTINSDLSITVEGDLYIYDATKEPDNLTILNGNKRWYQNKVRHKEDGPAIEYASGSKKWFINGKRHRVDGPAIEYSDGSKWWYKQGKQHREDRPAVENANGTKAWFVNGKRHRTDGPAIEYDDGYKDWYLNGKEYTEEEYYEKLKTL